LVSVLVSVSVWALVSVLVSVSVSVLVWVLVSVSVLVWVLVWVWVSVSVLVSVSVSVLVKKGGEVKKILSTALLIITFPIYILPVFIFYVAYVRHMKINQSFRTLDGQDFTYWR